MKSSIADLIKAFIVVALLRGGAWIEIHVRGGRSN